MGTRHRARTLSVSASHQQKSGAAGEHANPPVSLFEMLARWIFIIGLVALLGAATAAVARFGGTSEARALWRRRWFLAVLGLVLLAESQLGRNAAATFIELLGRPSWAGR